MRRYPAFSLAKMAAGIGLIFAACLCLEQFRPHLTSKQEEEVIRPVRTQLLSRSDNELKHYFGSVQGSQRVNLSFRVSGPLLELPAEKGAMAKKGDLLGRIDPRDFKTRLSQAQSLLAQAKAQYNDASANFKRYEELYKQKVIAASKYDSYKAQLEVTRSAVKQAEAQLTAAEDALADTELRAPFDGIIADRMVENYQDVVAKQEIINFQNIDTLEIVFNIPERDVVLAPVPTDADIKGLQEVSEALGMTARFDSFPGRSFPVKLKEFAAQADTSTRTYPVTVTMAQPENARVLPGMAVTVDVDFSFGDTDDFYTVPQSAVLDENGESYLWRCTAIDGNGGSQAKVTRVAVTVGSLRDDQVEVQGTDLSAGDVIATAGVHFLRDGQIVRLSK